MGQVAKIVAYRFSIEGGYLVPQLYIVKEDKEDFSPMSVLDGKQRLTTLRDFAEDKNV